MSLGSFDRTWDPTGATRIPWSRALSPGLLLGFAITTAVVAATPLISLRTIGAVQDANESAARTFDVRTAAARLLAAAVDAETGQRGFLITESPAYLEPYDQAPAATRAALARIRQLTAGDASQLADVNLLERAATAKLAELAATIRLRRERGFEAARAVVATDAGNQTMDEMRAIVARVVARERAGLDERSAHTALASRMTTLAQVGNGLISLLALAGLFAAVLRRGADCERAAQTAKRFEVTLTSIGDGVIATDDRGLVTHVNAVAEALTGWTEALAKGQPLDRVFVIVHEDSRQPVESPVVAVLRDQVIVDLDNHTLLLSRDGRELPIEDSAAPIKDAVGRMLGVVLVFRDVTDRRRMERERDSLLEAQTSLAAIVESSDDAIISKDLRGVIQSWNRGAEQIFGYQADEVIGQPVSMLAAPERRDEMPRILEQVARGERVDHYRSQRRAKNGRVIDVSLTVSPIRNVAGVVVGASKVVRDITQDVATERCAVEARRVAEQANRAKDQFLAVVSHELRNPLNAILGWSAVLRHGILDETERSRAIEAIHRGATHQARLIEELLDVSRIMSGKLGLDRTLVDLVMLAHGAIDIVRLAADEKHLHISVGADPALPPFYADAGRLHQVLLNLLSNAVKFTPAEGSIHLRLGRTNDAMELEVADTGQGLPHAHLQAIFDPFQQVEAPSTRSHGGLGLGLSIAKHLVEAHGGRISASSAGEHRGATFRVSLPIVVPTAPEDAGPSGSSPDQPAAEDSAPRLQNLLALVVDDDEDGRRLVMAILVREGAEVFEAASAAQALEVMRDTPVQLLVSDIAMPGEDGYSLMRRVRALGEPGRRALPAIALTSFARPEDRECAVAAGFDRHMAKPIEPHAFVDAVVALLSAKGATQPSVRL